MVFIGLGYIGLPTAVSMAQSGLKVTGVDINTELIESIRTGKLDFSEPGLEKALTEALESGRFEVSTDIPEANAFVIAVPTPFKDRNEFDSSFVDAAFDSISPKLRKGSLVILESTVPPRTTERLSVRVLSNRPDLVGENGEPLVMFAHCPERILPGNALEELKENDRVIGGMTPEASQAAAELYKSFCSGDMLITDDRTAELTKLTENAFRDVNIAFANELSIVCDLLSVDVWELIDLANHHPRVNILQPGPGVGGHCIAVDPWFIVSAAPDKARLIRTAREVNDSKVDWVVDRVAESATQYVSPTITLLGLAFKADIGDLRQSPSVRIAEKLIETLPQAHINAVEPHIESVPSAIQEVALVDLQTGIDEADIVVLLVDHKAFTSVEEIALAGKTIIDTKGLWAH